MTEIATGRFHWRMVLRRACEATSITAAVAAATLAVAMAEAEPSAAEATAGIAEVVAARDPARPGQTDATAGGSGTTSFSLRLPAGAACSGDSLDGGYRVQSFMVPAGVDPASLTFGALGPLPTGSGAVFRQPLFAVNTVAHVNAATDKAEEPGGPGPIINVPNFSLEVFTSVDLPAGEYRVGIACTKGPASPTQLDRFWVAPFKVGAAEERDAPPSWSAPVLGASSRPSKDTASQASAAAVPDDAAAPVPAPAGAVAPEPADPSATPSARSTGAIEASTASAGSSSGSQPSFGLPMAEIASSITISGSGGASLALWLGLALASARAAFLLASSPNVTPVPAHPQAP